MTVKHTLLIFATAALAAVFVSSAADAANPIPEGSYASSVEVCTLGSDDTDSTADLRQRFGSLSMMEADAEGIWFPIVPGRCDIVRSKPNGPTGFEMATTCDLGGPEDVVFGVALSPGKVNFTVLKSRGDGWFKTGQKLEQILCKKEEK